MANIAPPAFGAHADATPALTLATAWRPIVAGSVGNTIEWFDWSIYTAFALYFGPQFFPSDSETSALLATFGVFAVGFAMRPVGGLLIGLFNDRVGRRAALTLTILMMALPSLLIGLLPTYASIGVAAPILMVLARMVQGVSVGGEYGAAATFLAESAPPSARFLLGIHVLQHRVGPAVRVRPGVVTDLGAEQGADVRLRLAHSLSDRLPG
jgi:MHS family alpha-ketoglutarate permease-like MFS transporter